MDDRLADALAQAIQEVEAAIAALDATQDADRDPRRAYEQLARAAARLRGVAAAHADQSRKH